jgi:hypothetical protein
MDFDGNYRILGEISENELLSLREELADTTNAEWDSTTRQKLFAAHKHTSALILCFGPDEDPTKAQFTSLWPRWQPLCFSLIDTIINTQFGEGGKIIRLMIVSLHPNSSVAPHIDDLPVLILSHRVHIPIITDASVVFVVGNQVAPMSEGRIIEINNQRPHYVVNSGNADRIHLIFDYVPARSLTHCQNRILGSSQDGLPQSFLL